MLHPVDRSNRALDSWDNHLDDKESGTSSKPQCVLSIDPFKMYRAMMRMGGDSDNNNQHVRGPVPPVNRQRGKPIPPPKDRYVLCGDSLTVPCNFYTHSQHFANLRSDQVG